MGTEAGVGGWPGDGLVLYVLELAERVRRARLAGIT
jgi:hypothetical protein